MSSPEESGRRTGPTPPSVSMTLDWVVSACAISKRSIFFLVREGIVEVDQEESGTMFRPEMIDRIRTIQTLRKELGVNMAGIEIILRLRQKLIWHEKRHSRITIESWIDSDPSS